MLKTTGKYLKTANYGQIYQEKYVYNKGTNFKISAEKKKL